MLVCGIDPASSKNMGYCLAQITNTSFKIRTVDTKVIEYTQNIYMETHYFIKKLIQDNKIDKIVLERSMGFGLSFVRNQLSELVGIVKMVAAQNGIEVIELSPTEVKKTVTGSGKADKKIMRREISLLFGDFDIEQLSEHAIDAISTAYTYFIKKNIKVLPKTKKN